MQFYTYFNLYGKIRQVLIAHIHLKIQNKTQRHKNAETKGRKFKKTMTEYQKRNFQNAKNFIDQLSNTFISRFHNLEICELTNDDGVFVTLPIFKAEDILPESYLTFNRQELSRQQNLALQTWNKYGMLLVKDLLPDLVLNDLDTHAKQHLETNKSANSGDHFRDSDSLIPGKEGRGWNQRHFIRKFNPHTFKTLIAKFKKVQTLIFGKTNTTTEFQFNATFNDDIGHIHIDRPVGFLNLEDVDNCDLDLLKSMNKLSFQAAFYTENVPRSKGSTGFLPGSHKFFDHGINSVNLYHYEPAKEYLKSKMFHGDIQSTP